MAAIETTGLPERVFARFADICRIPHGSGQEAALGDYLLSFAADRGLDAERDEAGNVIIRKPATPGIGYPLPVIVQAHMDMVPAKGQDSEFDFANYPIRLVVDGEWLRADNTTLGADNGIGMAYILALLDEPDLPALEGLFTVDEEVGMGGALALDPTRLSGEYLINLDTEDEGVFCASCCGGMDAVLHLPVTTVPTPISGVEWHRLTVTGLMGGHSGTEIDKGRGNALRLLGRMLDDLLGRHSVGIGCVHGGILRNAIPAEAWADIAIPGPAMDAVVEVIEGWRGVFQEELRGAGERPLVLLETTDAGSTVLVPDSADAVVYAMNILPHGVEAMDFNMTNQRLVETSSNFALVRQGDGGIDFTCSIRSSLDSKRTMLARRYQLIADELGGSLTTSSGYPGWNYDPDSRIRALFQEAHRAEYGREAIVEGVHAGLECGVFVRKFGDTGRRLDIISLGPDIRGAHTPEEKANIPSVGRVWRLLLAGLRRISQQTTTHF